MIRAYRLSELAAVLDGQHAGEDVAISGLSIDSRAITKGDLFIAIKGPKFDGHAYAEQAFLNGAAAVLFQDDCVPANIPRIRVRNTTEALGLLGQFNRRDFFKPLIAVTGTCGKTSVKEMLAATLGQQGKTLSTEGNLNNAFGAPLTLSRLDASDEYAVVELGTSSPGEIDYISALAEPDVAIITNAAENHLKDLVSLEGVIHEKGFILDRLNPKGSAILNLDDPSFERWKARVLLSTERKVFSFSLGNSAADCFASDIKTTLQGMSFLLHLKNREGEIQVAAVKINFWGRHQVLNACCTALAASEVGLSIDEVAVGLESAQPFQRRGTRYSLSNGVMVIDESYNASPIATMAAIDQLADCQGRAIMVLGDMLDLRDVSEARHRDVGAYAREKGIYAFAGYGGNAELAVKVFSENAEQDSKACHFESKEVLSNWTKSVIDKCQAEFPEVPVTVLVKGSRGMEMLDVVRALVGSEYKGER